MGEIIFFFVISIIFIRSLTANISILVALIWLKRGRIKKFHPKHEYTIIIPVLREQKVIRNTIEHFLRMNYPLRKVNILIVSTEKENLESKRLNGSSKTTIEIVKSLEKSINKKYSFCIVKHIHYPRTDGKKIDQINYSFKYFLNNNKGKDWSKLFVGVYDADSKPNYNTLGLVSMYSTQYNRKVFQQSAIFFENFKEMNFGNNFISEAILKANCLLQTRWTIAYEIPRIIKQSFFINKLSRRVFLSHSVGHGLFLRGDLVREIKQMPSGTMNEDLFFGYTLSLLKVSINPLPVLESAEMPNGLSSSLKQKYVWFFGPLDHFSYERLFNQLYPGKANWILRKWFLFQGIIPALAWLSSGWLFLFSFVYPINTRQYQLLYFSFGAFLLYLIGYVLVMINYNFLNKLCSKNKKLIFRDFVWTIIATPIIIFIHSIPPIAVLYSKIMYIFIGKEPNKPKTER